MDMPIKIPTKFGRLSAQNPATQQRSAQPSELVMYLEMGIAIAAVGALLAMAACLWYAANHDWISSIQRFQEMI